MVFGPKDVEEPEAKRRRKEEEQAMIQGEFAILADIQGLTQVQMLEGAQSLRKLDLQQFRTKPRSSQGVAVRVHWP